MEQQILDGNAVTSAQTLEVNVKRISIVSHKSFEEVLQKLTATIGRPDIKQFNEAVTASATIHDLEEVVKGVIGSSDLMEFIRFDIGEVIRKEHGGDGPKVIRLVVGNPILMKEIAKTIPDVASYAPVTILVDERPDGVHLSYDSLASLIAPYHSQSALTIAKGTDAKIKQLLEVAAS
jgi:hypothetical protein